MNNFFGPLKVFVQSQNPVIIFVKFLKIFISIQVYFGTHHARWYLFFNTLNVPCCNGMSSIFNKNILEKHGKVTEFSLLQIQIFILT